VDHLTEIVVLFGAALGAACVARLLRAPTIIGFIAAGLVLGPAGSGLIHEDAVHFYAELGLMLLLFTVGLELSPEPLLRMGRRLLSAAMLQIAATALAAGVVMRLLWPMSGWAAAVVGVAVALSSTAIVLKQLSDRGETDTPAGGLTIGILIVQDIAVVLVMLLLPLTVKTGGPWYLAVGKALLALASLAVATVVARLLLPWLLRMVFRGGGLELMTLFALVMACTGAWLASLAGWSWALGSCIAGLLLAQTDLRHQLRAEITPFRDAFNALFFVSLGMLLDGPTAMRYAGPLAIAIVVTLVAKTVLTAGAVLVSGWPLRLSLTVGLSLCTVSEFGYVLAREAQKLELVPDEALKFLVAWALGTMLLGAGLVPFAARMAGAIAGRMQPDRADAAPLSPHGEPLRDHVVIVGYGVNGHNLARVLRAIGIPYSVIEMNRAIAERARGEGGLVVVGDSTRRSILEQAGLSSARALVVAVADQHSVRRAVAQAHAARPDLYILARTRYVAELEPLRKLGARSVIPEEFETSIEIFSHVLQEFGVPDNVIDQQVTLVRAGQYAMLRGRAVDSAARAEWMRMLELAVTQTHMLAPDSPYAGRTIREADLRARIGVTIVAITRNGQPMPNPPADMVLQAGDVLVLVGTHRQLAETRGALEPPESQEPT
jgi:CPA2 family monovalent cation:H+ antiporter-2